jgi:hypothetical protein
MSSGARRRDPPRRSVADPLPAGEQGRRRGGSAWLALQAPPFFPSPAERPLERVSTRGWRGGMPRDDECAISRSGEEPQLVGRLGED